MVVLALLICPSCLNRLSSQDTLYRPKDTLYIFNSEENSTGLSALVTGVLEGSAHIKAGILAER